MTAAEAKALGYEVVKASDCEVGLLKNGQGICTWWASSFKGVLPSLDHPKILETVHNNEELLHDRQGPI